MDELSIRVISKEQVLGRGEEPRRQTVAKSWDTGRGREGVGGREWWRVCLFTPCSIGLSVQLCLTQGLGSDVNMSVSSWSKFPLKVSYVALEYTGFYAHLPYSVCV